MSLIDELNRACRMNRDFLYFTFSRQMALGFVMALIGEPNSFTQGS